MKNIIITGSTGLVATELISLLNSKEYFIYAVSNHKELLQERYKEKSNITCLSLDELKIYSNVDFFALIHLGFARSKNPIDIASSVQFSKELLTITKSLSLQLFINISSQSVYGQESPALWTENTPVAPDYLYAMAKYSVEQLVSLAFDNSSTNYTNIRLSSVCENARFLNIFIKNALNGLPINVIGGEQKCSFIDVRDVAIGLITLLNGYKKVENIQPIYNLGTGVQRTIKDIALDVQRIFMEDFNSNIEVNLQPSDISLDAGVDPTLFRKTFNWEPSFEYEDMIHSLIAINSETTSKNNKGGL